MRERAGPRMGGMQTSEPRQSPSYITPRQQIQLVSKLVLAEVHLLMYQTPDLISSHLREPSFNDLNIKSASMRRKQKLQHTYLLQYKARGRGRGRDRVRLRVRVKLLNTKASGDVYLPHVFSMPMYAPPSAQCTCRGNVVPPNYSLSQRHSDELLLVLIRKLVLISLLVCAFPLCLDRAWFALPSASYPCACACHLPDSLNV
eukprot:759458-Hanusia_phi.AAC.1